MTGLGLPNSGKFVIAAKSPLTGGYGDGNIGSVAAVQMRKAGYDAVIIEGKAKTPVVLLIRNKVTEFIDGRDLWGLNSFATEAKLKNIYGRTAGIVSLGPGGENLVKFATIVSQKGRSVGRPGMGAVLVSKNLKAVVFEGFDSLPVACPNKMKELSVTSYREVVSKLSYAFWKQQGTMETVEWSQANSALPVFNYQEAVFDKSDEIGGFFMKE